MFLVQSDLAFVLLDDLNLGNTADQCLASTLGPLRLSTRATFRSYSKGLTHGRSLWFLLFLLLFVVRIGFGLFFGYNNFHEVGYIAHALLHGTDFKGSCGLIRDRYTERQVIATAI